METENTLIGKRVILFEMMPQDLEHFVKLHREDKNGFMGRFCLKEMSEEEAKRYVISLIATGQIKAWVGYTKEGKASKKLGYIYLSDISSFSCKVNGIIDKGILKGLGKVLRQGKYTFSEDAFRTVLAYCFNGAGFSRIQTNVFTTNKLSLLLNKKIGFTQEGIMRQSFKNGDRLMDVAIYAILKDEFKMPEKAQDIVTKEKQ